MRWKALLLVLPLLLLGGRTSHLKPEWVHWLKLIDATALNPALPSNVHIPPCIGRSSHKEAVTGSVSARHACYPSKVHNFQLTRFGIVVTEPLSVAADDCQLVLESSDDGTQIAGTEIASSSIEVGSGNADAGNCNDTLDTLGEFCMLDLDLTDSNTLIDAGGWYTLRVDVPGAGGPCTTLTGVQAVVWGYFK